MNYIRSYPEPYPFFNLFKIVQMKQLTDTLPDYGALYKSGLRTNEYQLVLSPHEELRNKILAVKKNFHETYPGGYANHVRPHILLAKFTQLEMMEEKILHRLRLVGNGYHPFKVELKNYGAYPTHSIYVNVVTRQPIQSLVKEIRQVQRLMKYDKDRKPHFIDEPMITIASRLQPWQYEQGWLEYSHRQFTGRFVADSMLLLKRRTGDRAWQIAERMEFKNLPVNIRQGELFA